MYLATQHLPFSYGARSGRVGKAFKEADIASKWAATAWAKKRAMRVKRATLNDFDRFVVKVNKQKVRGVSARDYRASSRNTSLSAVFL